MRTSLLLTTLLSIAQVSFAQKAQDNSGFLEGYIITVENDTLFGEVKFRQENDRMLNNIRYREKADAIIKSYNSNEIKAFKLGRYHYIVSDHQFLQEISRGPKLNIYENRLHKYKVKVIGGPGPAVTRDDDEVLEIFLIKKDGAQLAYVSNKKLIGKKLKAKLVDFFKDEPKLVDKIRQGYYTNADVIYMAYEYNNPDKYQLKLIDEKQYKKEKGNRDE